MATIMEVISYLVHFSRSHFHATDTSTHCSQHSTEDDNEIWTAYRFKFASVQVLKKMLCGPRDSRDLCPQVVEIIFTLVRTKVHSSQCYSASKLRGLFQFNSFVLHCWLFKVVVLACLASSWRTSDYKATIYLRYTCVVLQKVQLCVQQILFPLQHHW